MPFPLILEPYKDYRDIVNNLSYNTLKKPVYKDGEMVGVIKYLDLITSFDIETSSFTLNGHKCACMYTWQFGINGKVFVGRTWHEFEDFIKLLIKTFDLSETNRLIVWVHNLSYEFQFLLNRFYWSEVFAREKGEPMKALASCGIEFRCSYVLAGCSLDSVAKNLTMFNIKKLVGNLKYSKLRGYVTYLSPFEMQYCVNDVLIVMAYIYEQVQLYGNLLRIPMTNTGRVRIKCRKECFSKVYKKQYFSLMRKLIIATEEEYKFLRQAFNGGSTHANWRRVVEIIKDVFSRDITSSYPTVMIAEKFPMGAAKVLKNVTIEQLRKLRATDCCVFDIKIKNLKAKDNVYDNPLSASKCWTFNGVKLDQVSQTDRRNLHIRLNNGRVMQSDEVVTYTTDVDFFDVYERFYDMGEVEIGTVYAYHKEYLPTPIVKMIIELYEDKTTLKDIKEKALEYLIKKGMLNSTYGMSVMALCETIVSLENGIWDDESNKQPLPSVIADYNDDKKRFLYYPWGVFVTAYGRRNLFSAIYELGEDFIYADTDSVKFTNWEKHKAYFEGYNKWITERIKKALEFHGIDPAKASPKTIKGEEKPLGVWDDDGHYLEFKTLGAKRYMYRCINEKTGKKEIHTTVAGVSKDGLAKYLTRAERVRHKNAFEMFEDDMTIPARFAHKTTALYLDHFTPDYTETEDGQWLRFEEDGVKGRVKDYRGEWFDIDEKSFVWMGESDYHLGLTQEFINLIYSERREVNQY